MATTEFFSDLDIEFSPNPITGDVGRLVDDDAIKSAVVNLIMTERNDRLFRPGLHCGLQRDLFEPVTVVTAFHMKEKIVNVLRNFEPRVEVVSVDVTALVDEGKYNITLAILPRKNLNPIGVSFFLERKL